MAIKDRLRHTPVLGTALAVQERYRQDAGDQFAGAIGFFGFLSLFPLILLALSVAGFVLAGESDAQIAEVARTIQEAIPGLSAALGGGDEATGIGKALDTIIENRQTGGIIGLVLLMVGGLRVVNSAQTATLVIFRVDLAEMSGVKRKLKQLMALVLLGLLALAGAVAGGAIGAVGRIEFLGVMDVLAPVLTTLGTFVLDVGLFLAAYRLFGTSKGPPTSTLLPGAVLGGLGWTLLKLVGSTYVSGQVENANELYGAIGGVIGLMLLLYLAGRLYVYGAELSAVRAPDPANPSATAAEADIESRPSADDRPAAVVGAGAPLFVSAPGEAGPPPPPAAAHDPAVLAPTASEATRARLASMPEPPRSGHGRQALAFARAVGAVAGPCGRGSTTDPVASPHRGTSAYRRARATVPRRPWPPAAPYTRPASCRRRDPGAPCRPRAADVRQGRPRRPRARGVDARRRPAHAGLGRRRGAAGHRRRRDLVHPLRDPGHQGPRGKRRVGSRRPRAGHGPGDPGRGR